MKLLLFFIPLFAALSLVRSIQFPAGWCRPTLDASIDFCKKSKGAVNGSGSKKINEIPCEVIADGSDHTKDILLEESEWPDDRARIGKSSRLSQHVIAKDDANLDTNKNLSPFEACLCGAFATIVGDFVMHPIDTIKITQQSATNSMSFLGAARQIFMKQGLRGFYQGVVPYLIGDGSSGAVKFATFEGMKRFVENRLPEEWHPSLQFFCAAGAFCACSIILVPGEVLKTQIQAGTATSLVSALSRTIKSDGIRGLFAGYYATLVRDVPYTMLELGIYENVKAILLKKAQKEGVRCNSDTISLSLLEESCAAALTGAVAALFTTPLDLVKTKLTLQGIGGGEYAGIFGALRSIYMKGGIESLFVGATARVAWLVPFTIIYLGTYEFSKRSFVQT